MAAPARDILSEKLMSIGFSTEDIEHARNLMVTRKISFVHALETIGTIDSRSVIDAVGSAINCAVVHLEDRDIPLNIIELVPKQ